MTQQQKYFICSCPTLHNYGQTFHRPGLCMGMPSFSVINRASESLNSFSLFNSNSQKCNFPCNCCFFVVVFLICLMHSEADAVVSNWFRAMAGPDQQCFYFCRDMCISGLHRSSHTHTHKVSQSLFYAFNKLTGSSPSPINIWPFLNPLGAFPDFPTTCSK